MMRTRRCRPSEWRSQARAAVLFKAMDLDGDGFVSRSELALGLRSNPNLAGLLGAVDNVAIGVNMSGFVDLFTSIDSSGLGRISWPDFLARMQSVADEMPHVVAELQVTDDRRVVVSLVVEQKPRVSVSYRVALDGSVRLSLSQDGTPLL